MKCKFWNECKWYDEDSFSCKNKGLYYSENGLSDFRAAGCYNRMEEKNAKLRNKKI